MGTWTKDGSNNNVYSEDGNPLFALNGLFGYNTTGITVDETTKTVTLTADNLNSQNVNFSANNGNYTFALANGISAPTTSGEGKFESLTYKSGGGTGTRLYTFFRQKNSQLRGRR